MTEITPRASVDQVPHTATGESGDLCRSSEPLGYTGKRNKLSFVKPLDLALPTNQYSNQYLCPLPGEEGKHLGVYPS